MWQDLYLLVKIRELESEINAAKPVYRVPSPGVLETVHAMLRLPAGVVLRLRRALRGSSGAQMAAGNPGLGAGLESRGAR